MGNQQTTPTSSAVSTPGNQWHLFICNAYLIPFFTVNKDNATCQHQDERAAALGRVLVKSNPDIFMLQEAWGAGLGALETEIAGKFSVGEYCRSWWGSTVVDSVMQYANSRGGLYFGHNLSTCVNGNKISKDGNAAIKWRSYSTSQTKSKKGMVCVKYQKVIQDDQAKEQATATWTEEVTAAPSSEPMSRRQVFKAQSEAPSRVSTLLVFNTHLDPTNENNAQLLQLGDLAAFIHDVVYEERSLYPQQDFAAVVVGDFNFTPSCPQYRELFKIMKARANVDLAELLPEESKKTETYSAKNALVQWPTSCGRLDHIFVVNRVTFQESATGAKNDGEVIKTNPSSSFYDLKTVELVSDKVRDDVLVSDHYPFEVVLKF